MSIRVRLGLLFALATTVLLAAGGLVFVAQLHHSLLNGVDSTLRVRADALAQAVPDNGGGGNFQDTGGSGLLPRSESLAQVIDPRGRVKEFSDSASRQSLLTARQRIGGQDAPTFFTLNSSTDREHTRVLVVPVGRTDGVWLAVVGSTLEPTDNAIERVRTGLLVAAAPVVLVAGLGGWAVATGALRPVERMRRQAASISSHDSTLRLEVPATGDEIAALGETMNTLLAGLHAALDRERSFVADAGHELRTPLAILRGELELARRPGRSHSELSHAVNTASEETDRLCRLAEDLLVLARSDQETLPLQLAMTSVAPILERAAQGARPSARGSDLEITVRAAGEVQAVLDGDRLRQAVDNLLENALRFAPPATTVDIELRATPTSFVIEVRDRGSGFPTEFLAHAFERFRRSDQTRGRERGGTGLGLAIVRSIAAAHDGQATAGNRPEGGAVITLELPLDGPAR